MIGRRLRRNCMILGRCEIGLCSLGALKSYFSAPKRETSAFFFLAPPRYGVRRPNNFFDPQKFKSAWAGDQSAAFFFRRRLVMVFGGQITFSTPQKFKSAWAGDQSAAFFFFRRAPREKRPSVNPHLLSLQRVLWYMYGLFVFTILQVSR